MPRALTVIVSVVGRILLTAIFLLAAVGNKIPHFNQVAEVMGSKGVPAPKVMLAGAIVFLIVGSLSIIVGFRARFGALLLAVFLVLATYYFHNFWTLEAGSEAWQQQQIQFLKNAGLLGAMLLVMANGPGAGSLDNRTAAPPAA